MSSMHRVDPDTDDGESVLSRLRAAAVSPTGETHVLRLRDAHGTVRDFLPYFPQSFTVDEPLWWELHDDWDVPLSRPPAGVWGELQLRWPDVETVPVSESLFQEGESDG